jgi:hypothetical protein
MKDIMVDDAKTKQSADMSQFDGLSSMGGGSPKGSSIYKKGSFISQRPESTTNTQAMKFDLSSPKGEFKMFDN